MTSNAIIHAAVSSYSKREIPQPRALEVALRRKLKDVDIEPEYQKIQSKTSFLSAKMRGLVSLIYEASVRNGALCATPRGIEK